CLSTMFCFGAQPVFFSKAATAPRTHKSLAPIEDANVRAVSSSHLRDGARPDARQPLQHDVVRSVPPRCHRLATKLTVAGIRRQRETSRRLARVTNCENLSHIVTNM